jgi:ABC-2 type transport system permease protein
MNFRAIFRFELNYQLRQAATWIYFGVLFVFAFAVIRFSSPGDGSYANAPAAIAFVTVVGSLIWLLMAAAIAGDAAARDVQTRMYSLTYTSPVSKSGHLGGRFLAAFTISAIIQLAIPAGALIALYFPGMNAGPLGPFRLSAYLTAFGYIAIPTVFIATSIQFAFAAISGRAISAYIASICLLITSQLVSTTVAQLTGSRIFARLLDLIGAIGILSDFEGWTPIEKNTRLIALEGPLLGNRLLWLGIAAGLLAFTFIRFRFAHYAPGKRRGFLRLRRKSHTAAEAAEQVLTAPSKLLVIPAVRPAYTFISCLRQTLGIAGTSFRKIAGSPGGLAIVAAAAIITALFGAQSMKQFGIPLLPTTGQITDFLTAPFSNIKSPWVIIPLLTDFYAGELIWREREARMSEITDTAPVPEWALLCGKFLGLAFMLIAWLTLLMFAGIAIQADMGYHHFEISLYLKTLFGLQLTDYLLFALLALAVHVLVNNKYLGHGAVVAIFGLIAFAPKLGVQHHLLIYGTDPGWFYSDMRGFTPSAGPWIWFKTYWAAWALLIAVAARLFWVRGKEQGIRSRIRLARHRFTQSTVVTAAAAGILLLSTGAYIFYNTNILNTYNSASGLLEQRADYERLYGRYAKIAQPLLTGTSLSVSIYPKQRSAEIKGIYTLMNKSATSIDSIHIATGSEAETGEISFDRIAKRVLENKRLNYRIYALQQPLLPGDSLKLTFEVRYAPRGFRNSGADAAVVPNGTYFTNLEWLPVIGYQSEREINDPGLRKQYRLPRRAASPSLYDVSARLGRTGSERIAFDAVISTDGGQTAIAPGKLRRKWSEAGRNYFHYAADAPIGNEYAILSANYEVRRARWQNVSIEIFHHPQHAANLDRWVKSIRASLAYYSKEFGPYPYHQIRLIERPGDGASLHADAMNITYEEGFAFYNPDDGPHGLDLPFYVVAHEVAHQWWGAAQLGYAHVEGSPFLVEGLAVYSGMEVLEDTYGHDQLLRYQQQVMGQAYQTPRSRAGVPLIRAVNSFLGYRKGPLALYALDRYIGRDRVNEALRRLVLKHGLGTVPLPTTLDLYSELKAATPDSLRYLLHDLFEANTFWEFRTEQPLAIRQKAGSWQVTIGVQTRKVTVGEDGTETSVPLNDWVEVGVFAAANGKEPARLLYLKKHRIRSGKQTITVIVSQQPFRAGIDPNHLLTGPEAEDNVRDVKILPGNDLTTAKKH